MGKLREGEREGQEALRITLQFGDPLLIARSQDDLAILYLAKKKYDKARDMARLAEAEFARNGRADVLEPSDQGYLTYDKPLALSSARCASRS